MTPFALASVTTGTVFNRTLFYQSSVRPVAAPAAAADNTVTPDKWLVRWAKAVPRPPVTHTQPFFGYPRASIDFVFTVETNQVLRRGFFADDLITPLPPAAVSNLTTTLEWMPSWQGPPHYQPPRIAAQAFVSAPRVAPTLEWLTRWQGPPRQLLGLPGGQPFVPKEATLENTVTPDKWLVRFEKAVPRPPVTSTQPFFGYPYVAQSNLTTTLEWLPSWQGPPRYWPARIAAQPFVPKEAVLENTVTPDDWLVRFEKPVPRPPVWSTQPFYGYPYVAASNLTTTLEWLKPLDRAVAARPVTPTQPALQLFTTVQVTPDMWMVRWQGPPRTLLGLPGGQPFVPKEAVLENTVTPDKWLYRFGKAVPCPPVRPTQPFYGYPYEVQAIFVPYEQWWHQSLSRAAVRPPVRNQPYQPFVPREATAENTQTPDKWLQRWQGPPRYWPIKVQTPPFVPREATRENTQTPDKWWRDLGRAVARPPVVKTQPGWSLQPPPVAATPSILWFQPLGAAAPATPVRPTQPFFGYPYTAAAPAVTYQQSVTATLTLTVNFHFCGWGTAAEQVELFGTASEQDTAWSVVTEATEGVSTVSEQATAWSTEEQQEDDTEEQDPQCP